MYRNITVPMDVLNFSVQIKKKIKQSFSPRKEELSSTVIEKETQCVVNLSDF